MDSQSNVAIKRKEVKALMRHCNRTVTVKRLLSLREVVEEIGGTMWFWRSQIWAGRIPVVQVGKKQWIDMRDLDAFIESNKTKMWEGANQKVHEKLRARNIRLEGKWSKDN
ncbi:MAG: hypothetical protein ABSF90_20955 [Syntrophobacteraceae bacterium]